MVRRQLGRRLRSLREDAGMTREDVTLARICSRSKLEKLERGQNLIRPGDVRELCRVYRVDQPTTDLMTVLAYGTSDPSWLEYGDFLRPHFALYLWLESTANALCLFTRSRPPRIELVLGETALLRPVGSTPTMAAQRSWLRRLARHEPAAVWVLRLDAGPVPGMMGAFAVPDFDDPADPSIGYVETYDGARYPEKPAKVELLRRRFAVVREKSVPLQEHAP